MRLRGAFEGWAGVVTTLVLGLLVVGGALALAVFANRDYAGVDQQIFDEPGAVPLPGELECTAAADLAPVAGPRGVVAAIALREGLALVADDAGGLWSGDPGSGTLQRVADQPEVGGTQAMGRNPIRRHAFVAGPQGLAAVEVSTGRTVSSQQLPEDLASGVVSVAATTREVFLASAAGDLFSARWSYDRLGEVEPVSTRNPLPPVRQLAASADGSALLLVTDGPLLRLAVETGRDQQLPLGDVGPATSVSQGVDGLVYLADGETLRVLDLNERWVTGRLSAPVEGWAVPATGATGVAGGLLLTADDGTLVLTSYPTCNRAELTRLQPGGTP